MCIRDRDRDTVVKALDLGALGFIPKSAQRKVMISALQLVLSGGVYIPPQALSHAVPVPSPSIPPTAANGPAPRPSLSPADLGLTERQVDVLALMMQGKSNKAICRELDIAEQTVKTYVTAILKALSVANRTEVVIAANERGWKPESLKR